jgi:hypothetical protein
LTRTADTLLKCVMRNSSDREPERTRAALPDCKKALSDFLHSRAKKARFVTELYAAMRRLGVERAETDRVLAELEKEGSVMVRDHFCADPHLEAVDLRIVALVDSIDGTDAQLNAIQLIDAAWNKWLSEYLANHRCG